MAEWYARVINSFTVLQFYSFTVLQFYSFTVLQFYSFLKQYCYT